MICEGKLTAARRKASQGVMGSLTRRIRDSFWRATFPITPARADDFPASTCLPCVPLRPIRSGEGLAKGRSVRARVWKLHGRLRPLGCGRRHAATPNRLGTIRGRSAKLSKMLPSSAHGASDAAPPYPAHAPTRPARSDAPAAVSVAGGAGLAWARSHTARRRHDIPSRRQRVRRGEHGALGDGLSARPAATYRGVCWCTPAAGDECCSASRGGVDNRRRRGCRHRSGSLVPPGKHCRGLAYAALRTAGKK